MKTRATPSASAERMTLLNEEATADALVAGRRDGAEAERERCRAIIMSPEAKYRRGTAVSIATKSNLSVEAARSLLASLGEGSA